MKKEITPLVLFVAGLVAFTIVSVLGMVYSVFKALYESFQLKFWRGVIYFIKYWLKVLYQVWNVVKYFLMRTAVALDLFANVAGGELIEDCVTHKEETLYGKGDITISAATGDLEIKKELNKTGIWFTWLLSKALGQGHSIEAYLHEINKSEK